MKKSQNQNVFSSFQKPKMHSVSPFWAFLQTEMTDFPPFHTFQLVESLPYKTPYAYDKIPHSGEASP